MNAGMKPKQVVWPQMWETDDVDSWMGKEETTRAYVKVICRYSAGEGGKTTNCLR